MNSLSDFEHQHAETRDLIPWWVNGRLTGDEARRVESHVAQCAECRADMEVEHRVRAAVRHRTPVEYAPQASLQKLWSRIEDVEREMPTRPTPGAKASAAAAERSGTRWKVAAGVLLGVGMGLLAAAGWQAMRTGGPAEYSTATTAQPMPARPAQVRVVFAPAVSVEELTRIVAGNGFAIVDGPSESGVYGLTVAAADADSAAAALARLRADPRVRFAEPVESQDP